MTEYYITLHSTAHSRFSFFGPTFLPAYFSTNCYSSSSQAKIVLLVGMKGKKGKSIKSRPAALALSIAIRSWRDNSSAAAEIIIIGHVVEEESAGFQSQSTTMTCFRVVRGTKSPSHKSDSIYTSIICPRWQINLYFSVWCIGKLFWKQLAEPATFWEIDREVDIEKIIRASWSSYHPCIYNNCRAETTEMRPSRFQQPVRCLRRNRSTFRH